MNVSIDVIKGEKFFIASVKEFPAILTQGRSIKEAKENMLDALILFLKMNLII